MARAQRLVAVVLTAELAAILHPQMAATGAQAMRSRRVTHRPAQVPLVGVGVSDYFVLGKVVLCMPSMPCRSDLLILL